MTKEIEIYSDGDGLAFFGDPAAIDVFLSSAGVQSREFNLNNKLQNLTKASSVATDIGSQISANSGRWVKLTEESAKAMKVGKLMKGSSGESVRAVLTNNGKTAKILEFIKPGSVGSMLTNPAVLAGAAGIMAQLAMQQTMDEITDYLAKIDEKVDDVLRAQKDAALAQIIGVGFTLDDAMTIRQVTGRVSETTWSKIQHAGATIDNTQAYALRQLDALAEKLEKKSAVGDRAKLASDAEEKVQEWLSVLSRSFQLRDALAILELDRVFDSSPKELDLHRRGLKAARDKRRDLIGRTTGNLLQRIDQSAQVVDRNVLFHPFNSRALVKSGNQVAVSVIEFNRCLGFNSEREQLEARPWKEVATEAKDDAVQKAIDGANTVKRVSAKTFDQTVEVAKKLSAEVSHRIPARSKKSDSSKEK